MSGQKLLFHDVRLSDREELCDVLIDDGVINSVDYSIHAEDARRVSCDGNLLLPAFIDCHTHLDKACMETPREAEGLMDAVNLTAEYQRSLPKQDIFSDVLRRGASVLEMALRHGTGLVRSHVSVDEIWGMEAFYASCALRKKFSGIVDLQLSVPFCKSYADEWDEAARTGEIDYIAGYPSVMPDPQAAVDELFSLAERYALPLDLHVDESDKADISCFVHILQKTIETGLTGRVNCSHVTALSAVGQRDADEAIALCEKARVSVIALPSCNMYLMGRCDRGLIRRGVTRIDELQRAGVNTAIASDNIRDPFRPFGNADMLEEASFTCQVLSRGTRDGMCDVIDMATRNAAAVSGKECYGVQSGAPADLVLVAAKSIKQAIIERSERLIFVKNGVILREDMP